jgi:ketol-acid reductoisomerase
VIGKGMPDGNAVDNRRLIDVNAEIRSHSVEVVGARLRGYMTGMKAISSAD